MHLRYGRYSTTTRGSNSSNSSSGQPSAVDRPRSAWPLALLMLLVRCSYAWIDLSPTARGARKLALREATQLPKAREPRTARLPTSNASTASLQRTLAARLSSRPRPPSGTSRSCAQPATAGSSGREVACLACPRHSLSSLTVPLQDPTLSPFALSGNNIVAEPRNVEPADSAPPLTDDARGKQARHTRPPVARSGCLLTLPAR